MDQRIIEAVIAVNPKLNNIVSSNILIVNTITYIILIGYILFDNIPSLRTLFGALIIISAGIYIYLREKIKEQLIVSDNPIR